MKKIFLVVLILTSAACDNASFRNREKGALAGGAMGAGLGAIIGHQVGSAGAGVAIGSALGALSGGIIGSAQDRTEDDINASDQKLDEQERQLAENKKILDELRARGADVRSTKRGIVVNLPDVLFEFGSSQLTSEARNTVGDIADVVKKYEDKRISVEGHTDSVGTVNYNMRLSQDRARSVANELNYKGIAGQKLKTKGYGESDPIASNQSETGRRRNRRVEVIIESN
jgi:outer membrane protein OmpA-like peptidoglycan-associated protein